MLDDGSYFMNVFQPFLSLPTLPLRLVDLGLWVYKFASLYTLTLTDKFNPGDSDNNSHPGRLGDVRSPPTPPASELSWSCQLHRFVRRRSGRRQWGHTLTGYLATINFRIISVKKHSIKRLVKEKKPNNLGSIWCLFSNGLWKTNQIIISIKNTNAVSSSEDTDDPPVGQSWMCLLSVLNTWLSLSSGKKTLSPSITFTWEESQPWLKVRLAFSPC